MRVMLIFGLLLNLGYQVILFTLLHDLLVIFIIIILNFNLAFLFNFYFKLIITFIIL